MATSEKTEKISFLVFLCFLVFLGFYILAPFLAEIVLSIALAVLFYPLHEKFLKWTKNRPNLATFLSVSSIILFLVIPAGVILTLVTTQLGALIVTTEKIIPDPSVSGVLEFLQQKIDYFETKMNLWMGISLNLSPVLQRELSNIAQSIARYSPKMIIQTANFFLRLFIMIVVLTYLLRDGKYFIAAFIRITPIKDRYEHKLAKEIHQTIKGIFYGQFVTGILQAGLATVGFLLLGIPAYLVWGLLTFLVSFLPSVGTGAVVVPMVVTLFLQGKMVKAIIMLIYGVFIIGGVDNILRPFLIKSNMHPMFLFLSLFGGLVVFGPIGIILGPMLMALLSATIRIYADDFSNSIVRTQAPPSDNKIITK